MEGLTKEEIKYIEKYICMLNDLKYYQKNCSLVDKTLFIDYLKKEYIGLQNDIIEDSIIKVKEIYKYKQKKLNNQLKEQKRMIKKMNHFKKDMLNHY